MGMAKEVGSIEVGKRADLAIVDLSAPHLTPNTSIERLLVFHATARDVRDVVVDGRIRVRNHRIVGMALDEIVAEANEEAARAFECVDVTPFLGEDETPGAVLRRESLERHR